MTITSRRPLGTSRPRWSSLTVTITWIATLLGFPRENNIGHRHFYTKIFINDKAYQEHWKTLVFNPMMHISTIMSLLYLGSIMITGLMTLILNIIVLIDGCPTCISTALLISSLVLSSSIYGYLIVYIFVTFFRINTTQRRFDIFTFTGSPISLTRFCFYLLLAIEKCYMCAISIAFLYFINPSIPNVVIAVFITHIGLTIINLLSFIICLFIARSSANNDDNAHPVPLAAGAT